MQKKHTGRQGWKRLQTFCKERPMKSYYERVRDFWMWFSENEEKLSEYLGNMGGHEPEEIINFLGEGIGLAIEGCHFETGGDFEVSLASEGSLAMMFLTNYLVENMPEHFQEKWHFSPWKPAVPGAQIRIHGVLLGADDILVEVSPSEESAHFNLRFYNETLAAIDEDQRYHILFLILEMTLGENICMGYVGFVEMAETRTTTMIPLADLWDFMKKTLDESGTPLDEAYNPCHGYSGYSMEPTENPMPRFDIIAGFTSLPTLLDEYYEAENRSIFDLFAKNGAKAAFIAMHRNDPEDHKRDLELRNAIADRLETEVLGAAGSGGEIGIILGQGLGLSRSYIDLLLYDEKAFLEKAGAVLQDFGEAFFLYDYHQNAEPRMLI